MPEIMRLNCCFSRRGLFGNQVQNIQGIILPALQVEVRIFDFEGRDDYLFFFQDGQDQE